MEFHHKFQPFAHRKIHHKSLNSVRRSLNRRGGWRRQAWWRTRGLGGEVVGGAVNDAVEIVDGGDGLVDGVFGFEEGGGQRRCGSSEGSRRARWRTRQLTSVASRTVTGLGGDRGGGSKDGDCAQRKERRRRGMWRRQCWRTVLGSRKRRRTALGSEGYGLDLKWSGALVFKWSNHIRDTDDSKRRHRWHSSVSGPKRQPTQSHPWGPAFKPDWDELIRDELMFYARYR